MKTIRVGKGIIEGKERLKLFFPFDREVIALVRTIPDARWDPGERCWHISLLAGPVEKLNRRFKGRLKFLEKMVSEPDEGAKQENGVSLSYQNQAINAIKFYYEQVLGRPVRTYYVQRPKKGRMLPSVLSEQEVQKILNSTDNLKHKAILSLIYSAGLRRGELINFKPQDIDSKRMYVIIRGGKGNRDRYSILSEKVLEL